MNLHIAHADVWMAEIDDTPGALARSLRAIADYGADLDYVVARRQPEKPGKGVVLISGLKSKDQIDNADQAGFKPATNVTMLRIEGPNEPGIGSKLMKLVADAGVNMNGVSASVLGHRFVCYTGFDSLADRDKAETALKAVAGHDWKFWQRHPETKVA